MDEALPQSTRLDVTWGQRLALWVFDFGLACCAVEFVAATVGRPDLFALAQPGHGSSGQLNVMVVAGTVTDKIAPSVRGLYDAIPAPRAVVSFGACANCGGPYWDSYAVTKGVDQIIPVDVYVPGCPPRPEALLDGLRRLTPATPAPRSGSSLTAPLVPAPAGLP